MHFRKLSRRLQAYILFHPLALVPAFWALARLPGPRDRPVVAALLAAAIAAGAWRFELTVARGKQSLVFAVVCLALVLQGVQAAVLCAAAGALITHLIRPQGAWWRIGYIAQPFHRRLFNVTHCALVCAAAGLAWSGLRQLPVAGPWWDLASVVAFASLYFLLNTFGVSTAIALEQGSSPAAVWREHFFWMAPAYLVSAAGAVAIAWVYGHVGAAALLLMPCLYLVYRAQRTYVETLKSQRELAEEVNRLLHKEEEANRRKDEFLAMLAHELRNPLGAIANAHYLLSQPGGLGDAQSQLAVVGRQTRHLKRLVEDLLDVSRITRGVVELHSEVTDVRQLLRSALDLAQPIVEGKGHRLTIDVPKGPLPARVDPSRMAQVFANLLCNAAKYTEPGGRLKASLREEEGQIVFRMRDTGVGIDPDLLPRIFDLFVQADRSLSHSDGGLGIGLTLVKHLVELHGGGIEAHSAGLNQGSEFVVKLPLLKAEGAPAGVPMDGRMRDEGATGASVIRHPSSVGALNGGGNGALHPSSLILPSIRTPVGAPSRCVLVAEDQEDAGETLVEMLEMWGYEPVWARTGRQALDLFDVCSPGVAILDVGLPGIDGYELARAIRDRSADVVLIAVTGYGRPEEREAALQAGFDHHLVKPLDAEALRDLLDGLLREVEAAVSGMDRDLERPAAACERG
jgi:signal transduction histidine kinase/ActR/RegA family two-component response regulator